MATESYDIVIYGNTFAAVTAACAAKVEAPDLSVCLMMPYLHVGGIISNGLGELDFGAKGTKGIGWMTAEFLRRLTLKTGQVTLFRRASPSSAETAFMSMLAFYGVTVRAAFTLASVQKSGAAITSFTATDGTVFTGSRFLDCTEEGDAAKMSGVTMVTGRESQAQYGETLAGFSAVPSEFIPFDCYSGGVLLPGFQAHPGLNIGDADGGVQSYGFRLCVTNVASNRRKWPKPTGYDPSLFEYRRRLLHHTNPAIEPFRIGMCVDGKADVNSDFGGPLQWQWPEATPTARLALFTQIYKTQAGWMWFLQNDSSVHPEVRAKADMWGPCKDEFPGFAGTTLGWPKELYVRVGRRMVGNYVMKQSDLQTNVTKTTSIAVGFYSIDNHIVNKWATTVNGVAGYIPDSMGYRGVSQAVKPYQIPYDCIRPLNSECSNLLVPVAASCSNVAMASYRIDLHKANVAAAAGLIAAYSIVSGTSFNSMGSVIVSVIQPKLTAYGHVWQPPA
jgi:hypothetical protein